MMNEKCVNCKGQGGQPVMKVGSSPVYHIRVSGGLDTVDDLANVVADSLVDEGYELIEKSVANPSRMSDGTGRVYITVR